MRWNWSLAYTCTHIYTYMYGQRTRWVNMRTIEKGFEGRGGNDIQCQIIPYSELPDNDRKAYKRKFEAKACKTHNTKNGFCAQIHIFMQMRIHAEILHVCTENGCSKR